MLTPTTRWEWTVASGLLICGIIIAVAVGEESVLDAVLVGLATLGGLASVYQGSTSTPARRLAQLGWLAYLDVVFLALSGI